MQINRPYQEEGILKQANPWLIAAQEQLQDKLKVLNRFDVKGFKFLVKHSLDSVWLIARWPSGGGCAFRLVNCAGSKLEIKRQRCKDNSLDLTICSSMGTIDAHLEFIDNDQPFFHWTITLKSSHTLSFSCMPRDIYPLDEKDNPLETEGEIYSRQRGPEAGILYFTITKPKTGSISYLQNFTKLNDYFEQTHSAPINVVQGQWPELGFSIPGGEKPLLKGKEVIISDAYVCLSPKVPEDQFEAAKLYLDMKIVTYLRLEKPETQYHNYIIKANKALKDIDKSRKCYMMVKKQKYLRPYVGATDKPPESMVQLAVLMPMVEYERWQEEPIKMCQILRDGLKNFFASELKTIVRYLPGVDFDNENKEVQEDSMVMDSWYLFHPLLNLARLAQRGFQDAKKLFFDSLDYAIAGAHRFNYHWPVFYNMKTLEEKHVEGSPKEGEPDVACIYALVMVHAYELSKDKRYLKEAEAAADSLGNIGFNLPYQMNVTSFGISAFWRLYKLTGNEHYKKLVTLCVANILCRSWLWVCDYGYGKYYSTFFGIPPLANMGDNNYLASYEEKEVLSAFEDLFDIAEEEELSPSIRLLLSEFSRHNLARCLSYYPSEVPKEMLAEKIKTGHIDPQLAIPIEDLRQGWEKAGQVGQEVYGTGGVFITITRHYNHRPGWPFIVYCEYMIKAPEVKHEDNEDKLFFYICGDNRLQCELRILQFRKKALPQTKLFQFVNGEQQLLKGEKLPDGCTKYCVSGGTHMIISWSKEVKHN